MAEYTLVVIFVSVVLMLNQLYGVLPTFIISLMLYYIIKKELL